MKNEKCIKNASKVHQKYMMFHVDFGNLVTLNWVSKILRKNGLVKQLILRKILGG